MSGGDDKKDDEGGAPAPAAGAAKYVPVPGHPLDLHLGRWFFVCMLVPLVVFVASRGLQRVFIGGDTAGFASTITITPLLESAELSARLLWFSALLFFWAVCVTAAGFFIFSHRHFLQGVYRSWTWWAIGILIVIMVLILWQETSQPYQIFGQDLFVDTVGQAFFGAEQGARLAAWIKVTNISAAVGAAFVVVGVASLTGQEPARADDSIDRKCRVLARQIAEVRVYLYLGAALLVSGMVATHAFFLWPLPYIAGVEHQEAYKELAKSLFTSNGVAHVLVLAATFGPPLLILNLRGRALADEALGIVEIETRRTWRLERGLVASLPGQAMELVAILSPLLASPIGAVLSHMAT